jgi:hypothetical protein
MSETHFSISGTSYIPEHGSVILHGSLVSGQIAPGMLVTVGPADRPAFREPIHAIGSVRPRADAPEELALVFRCVRPADGERWRALFRAGQSLAVPTRPVLHACPCCELHTLAEANRGSHEICRVCNWQDDGVQSDDPEYRGGANHESLAEARAAFASAHPHLFPSPDA